MGPLRTILLVICVATELNLSAQTPRLGAAPDPGPPVPPGNVIRIPAGQNLSGPVAQPPPIAVTPGLAAIAANPPSGADTALAFDALSKEYTAQLGEATANFAFNVTNVSNAEIIIDAVRPSCGCTVAKLPSTPWKMAPGDHGQIELAVDLRGKSGVLTKYATVSTDKGPRMLNIKINVPATPITGADSRVQNIQLAMADRQAVFKNDCASCHAVPTIGKMGEQLYQAGCAVCHDSPHRASMVPDLRALKTAHTKETWKAWIVNGKLNSLMPAFSKPLGGPLSDEQIESLAEYLTKTIRTPGIAATAPVPTTAQ